MTGVEQRRRTGGGDTAGGRTEQAAEVEQPARVLQVRVPVCDRARVPRQEQLPQFLEALCAANPPPPTLLNLSPFPTSTLRWGGGWKRDGMGQRRRMR